MVTMKMAVFWVVARCRLVGVNSYESTRCCNPEGSHLNPVLFNPLCSFINSSSVISPLQADMCLVLLSFKWGPSLMF
jgi:hypothetical protein